MVTSITAQKRTQADRPMLVRLGQREPEIASSDECCKILRALPNDPKLNQDQANAHTMATESYLIARFSMYQEWPSEVWTLSKRFNPSGYPGAMVRFLHMDPLELDFGHAVRLQTKALKKGPLHEAIKFLESAPQQNDIDGIVLNSLQTSLDGERRNNLAKQCCSAAGKVSGVQHVSRNLILSRYNLQRSEEAGATRKNLERWRKDKYLSHTALAVQKNPHLFARGRGKLHWECDISAEMQQRLTFAGDPVALRDVIARDKHELVEESSARRATAIESLQRHETQINPKSNKAWLQWMGDNPDDFNNELQTATPRRRSFNLRTQGNDSDLPAVERIYPHPRNSLPKWAVLLSRSKAGFYNLVLGASKQVVFSVGLRSRCWAFPLVQISPRKFAYDWSTRMCELLQPIGKCLMDLGLDLAACQPSVQRLEVTRSRSESQVVIYIRHAYLVDAANVPERGAHGDSETDCLEAEDSEVASCSSDVESTQDGVDAECVSDISDVPDCGVEAEDEAEDDLAGDIVRNPRGVFVLYSCEYATLSHIPRRNKQYFTIRVRSRWRRELSSLWHSKTFPEDVCGGDEEIIVFCLKCWLLYRLSKNNFLKAKPMRKHWWLELEQSLREQIAEIHSETSTGAADADAFVREWAPGVLQF